ncbi:hypothetical protein EV356DRAFT_536950 [Viridothelium virens]|uniref:Transcription factor IIIC subunit 5 HTH domain-containing protein n=1 Tax=Viridothelium virens TaxID=1048519 RepID=A0A6A6GVM7_VIRVR|nr:hypothetical protein EV356DRAFT_536950 [Viridothelium virens]
MVLGLSETSPQAPAQQNLAPQYHVPQAPLANVEHPCRVKDVDRGVQSLGGNKNLEKLLTSTPGTSNIAVSLKPEDSFSQSIISRPVKTNSIAFKVSVPKWTGRKRKRGSDDPYVEDPSYAMKQTLAAEDVLKRLRDNPDGYHIEAIGHINETHRFRAMPDFVSSITGVPLLEKVRSHILPFDFDKIKDFKLAPDKGISTDIYIPPPKVFDLHRQPYNYLYRQNPAVRVKHDSTTGQTTLHNSQQPARLILRPLPSNAPTLPTTMPPGLQPFESLSADVQSGITKLRAFLNTRPVITRRVSLNYIGRQHQHHFKLLSQYCGYQFRSGPWRDTLVRYGVDPRSDPEYRKYQTVMFQMAPPSVNWGLGGEPRERGARQVERGMAGWSVGEEKWRWNRAPRYKPKEGEGVTHEFDGKKLWTDGKVWQVCDVMVPLLREVMDKSPLRAECDLESDGWFANGALAKLRVIMKDMINLMMNEASQDDATAEGLWKGPSEEDETVWKDIAELMPDIIDEKRLDMTFIALKRKESRLEELATQVRSSAKRSAGGKYHKGASEMGMFDAKRNAEVIEAKNLAAEADRENESSEAESEPV